MHFSGPHLPYFLEEHSLLNTVQYRNGIYAHTFNMLNDNVQTMCDKNRVLILMFDNISIRSLSVPNALRTLEATAGEAVLQLMPRSV